MQMSDYELFKGLNRNFIEQIDTIAVKESHSKGMFLFRTGDPAQNFYILLEGRICIRAEDKGFAVSFVRIPGDFFGWSSLLNRPSYSASAECVVPSTVIKIAKEKLNILLQQDPASGLTFYKNFAGIIGGRFIDSLNIKDWFPSVET